MNLDEELCAILRPLGVVLEAPAAPGNLEQAPRWMDEWRRQWGLAEAQGDATITPLAQGDARGGDDVDDDACAEAEVSIFQTSREHYGVFYRLDLVGGAPHLRVFVPEEGGPVKMRCYLVRAALGSPVRDWFLASRAHSGSLAYEDASETIEQHLLFAAGEVLKRLFWAGEQEHQRFPDEIEVCRLV